MPKLFLLLLGLFILGLVGWGYALIAYQDPSDVECTKADQVLKCVDHVCLNNTCTSCTADAECNQVGVVCNSDGYCVHKNLWPFNILDYVGTLLIVPAAVLAAGSGMGGGNLFVPLLLVVVRFPLSQAIPISKVMIFGVAVAAHMVNWNKKHPHANASLIDYSVLILFEPITLAGTVFGVLLNSWLPDAVIVFFLFFVLVSSASISWRKGISVYKKETANKKQGENQKLLTEPGSPSFQSINQFPTPAQEKSLDPSDEMIPRSEIRLNRMKVLTVMGFWVFLFGLSLFKGGDANKSLIGIEKCSVGYWGIAAAIVPFGIISTYAVGRYLLRTTELKLLSLEGIQEGQIQWNLRRTIISPCFVFFAGVVAGFMGLGGGVITNPVLLELGMDPAATAATSQFMILFTSSATVFQFMILGRINFSYAIYYAIIGFISALFGKVVLNKVLKRMQRTSYVILFLVVFILLGAFSMLYIAIDTVLREGIDSLVLFHNICHLYGPQ